MLSKMKYPIPLKHECGCKVSWRTYKTAVEAEEASKIASIDAEADLAEGYDFGYLSPGSIAKNEDGTYTVVCP